MGGPKQMLQVGDRFLIDFVLEPLRSIGPPALIGAGPVPDHLEDLERIADADGAAGPLAGVLGALRSDPGSTWLIVACDQPWVTETAIDWLLAQRIPGAAAVMPRDSSRVQPFPGIYEPGFATVARDADRGTAISALAGDPRVHSRRIPPEIGTAWASVNRPEDLRRLDPESRPDPASRAGGR